MVKEYEMVKIQQHRHQMVKSEKRKHQNTSTKTIMDTRQILIIHL